MVMLMTHLLTCGLIIEDRNRYSIKSGKENYQNIVAIIIIFIRVIDL